MLVAVIAIIVVLFVIGKKIKRSSEIGTVPRIARQAQHRYEGSILSYLCYCIQLYHTGATNAAVCIKGRARTLHGISS